MPEGMVIRSTGSWYVVSSSDGRAIHCRLRGQYRLKGQRYTNPIAVGDIVEYEMELDRDTAVILAVNDRTNFIIRKATRLSSSAHIIAANLDQAILVATLVQPRTSTGFIDRFLATAEAYHIQAVLVFNKIDLLDRQQRGELDTLVKIYENIGYQVLETSAKLSLNIDDFRKLIEHKISLLSGHSGVGKSALVNVVDPTLNLRTGEISAYHQKGKHTTTFAEMHPLANGGWIVDTPGIKEFGLYDFEAETLAQRFPEMRSLMHECRFANCTHMHEPGCAIKDAVENGSIAGFRYKNYQNMMLNDFTNDD